MHKAGKFMKRLTPEDKTHYILKLAASDLFRGQKDAYPGSVARPFLTTHLSTSSNTLGYVVPLNPPSTALLIRKKVLNSQP